MEQARGSDQMEGTSIPPGMTCSPPGGTCWPHCGVHPGVLCTWAEETWCRAGRGVGALFEPPPPLCDIPSGCCVYTGPWTVTRSSRRMLRRVTAFCRPLRPVLLLV